MALVRTSDKSGYYVDIFRSDNPERNDYVYHNIGDELTLLNSKREAVPVVPVEKYPVVGKDNPGFRYFSNVKKAENRNENLIALFTGKNENSEPVFMQVLVPGKEGRTYYRANSLHTKTAGRQYSNTDPPVFTMVDNGESSSKPFISVFEPYGGTKNDYTVERISSETRNDGKEFTALTVFNRDNTRQVILQSVNPEKSFTSENGTFTGALGIAGYRGEVLTSLYLGEGKEITCGGYSLKTSEKGSASITIKDNELTISCNQSTIVGVPVKMAKKITLQEGSKVTVLKPVKEKSIAWITVPQVMNATLKLK
jgi:hypothetical protein